MPGARLEDVEDGTTEESISDGEEGVTDQLEPAKLIVGTAFDAYFLQTLPAPQTSSSVFSSLLQPLTSEEYALALTSTLHTSRPVMPPSWAENCHTSSFARFARELEEGFNLLFYGLGSKRVILNKFASKFCSNKGHVIIANSFQPNFSLKELLNSIEQIPGIQNLPLPSSGIEKQAHRIYDFFVSLPQKHSLYLIVHNIDAPVFRTPKARSCLSLLALNPHIHLVASVDRINSPLLWSSAELSTRKEINLEGDVPRRGYAWLWHDLTTLSPYDVELMHADRSSISGASAVHGNAARNQQETGGTAVVNGTPMSETAAQHILTSVTQKAKRLFALLAERQLETMDEASDTTGANAQRYALAYDILFSASRDNFIATNDTAMRSLLAEFRDHGLVLSAVPGGPGSGEVLWVPLRKERLVKVLKSLNIEQ